jgi:hypothetical protein
MEKRCIVCGKLLMFTRRGDKYIVADALSCEHCQGLYCADHVQTCPGYDLDHECPVCGKN